MPRLELELDEMKLIVNSLALTHCKMTEREEETFQSVMFLLGDLISDEELNDYHEQKMENELAQEYQRELEESDQ